MEAIELHINARYYAQHPALKSVYGKSQSVIGGKLFSSYRTVFELAQEYSDSKTSDFYNYSSNEALVEKEALAICRDKGVCIISVCALSLSSVLARFIHLHYDTGSLGKSTPASGGRGGGG